MILFTWLLGLCLCITVASNLDTVCKPSISRYEIAKCRMEPIDSDYFKDMCIYDDMKESESCGIYCTKYPLRCQETSGGCSGYYRRHCPLNLTVTGSPSSNGSSLSISTTTENTPTTFRPDVPDRTSVGLIVGIIVGLVVLLAIVVVIIIWRKKINRFIKDCCQNRLGRDLKRRRRHSGNVEEALMETLGNPHGDEPEPEPLPGTLQDNRNLRVPLVFPTFRNENETVPGTSHRAVVEPLAIRNEVPETSQDNGDQRDTERNEPSEPFSPELEEELPPESAGRPRGPKPDTASDANHGTQPDY